LNPNSILRFSLLASIILAGIIALVGAHGATAPSLEDRALTSTVYVGLGAGPAHGTGFVVGPDRILTAKHVVEKAEKVTIKFSNTVEIDAKVLWKGEGANDVALLEADTRGRPALPLTCAKPKRGEPVMAFGHPKFMTDIATYGRVSGFVTEPELLKEEADAVILDVTLAPGNSGGPVLDMQGRVVGMANAIVVAMSGPFGMGSAGTGHSIMLPSNVICGLLNK
jgi:S1-C subfamily serine protease